MNALSRLWRYGAADADERVARMLAPRSHQEADRYLRSSAVVRFVDRLTVQLESWWKSSVTGQAASTISEQWFHPTAQSPRGGGLGSREGKAERHRTIGLMLLIAAVTHITLSLIQGPSPGWYWLLIPGMVIVFALLLLAASRS